MALSHQTIAVTLPEVMDKEIPIKDSYLEVVIESDVSNKADEAIQMLHNRTIVVQVDLLNGNEHILESYTVYCRLYTTKCTKLDYTDIVKSVQKTLKLSVLRVKHDVYPLPVAQIV